jgi:DNA-binding LytR/AlgR family response regulator
MGKIRCIAIDDEPLALQLVCDYIRKTPLLELTYSTTKPLEALQIINSDKVDLIFLDVQMPDISGFHFLQLIKNKCKVVLITAYQEYALQGFDHDVLDYLLKPISFERFLAAVQKAKERMASGSEKNGSNYFFVKTEHKAQKIKYEDVIYIEGLRDYVVISTVNSGKILSLQPMRLFEEMLSKRYFIRIHKSYIISIEKIDYIEKNRVKINDLLLPIGETYKEEFLKTIGVT